MACNLGLTYKYEYTRASMKRVSPDHNNHSTKLDSPHRGRMVRTKMTSAVRHGTQGSPGKTAWGARTELRRSRSWCWPVLSPETDKKRINECWVLKSTRNESTGAESWNGRCDALEQTRSWCHLSEVYVAVMILCDQGCCLIAGCGCWVL
jgi:hypothetical protein